MDRDPVDEYYKPLTKEERDAAVRGQFPPYGEMLGWVRRWEATVRALEVKSKRLSDSLNLALPYVPLDKETVRRAINHNPPSPPKSVGWHRPYCDAPDDSDLTHPDCICG